MTNPASSWGPELDGSWQNFDLDAEHLSLPVLNDPAISAAIHDFTKFQGVDADTFAQTGDQYVLDHTAQSSLIDVPGNSNPTPTGGALQMQQPINGQSPIYTFRQTQRTPTESHSAQYAKLTLPKQHNQRRLQYHQAGLNGGILHLGTQGMP